MNVPSYDYDLLKEMIMNTDNVDELRLMSMMMNMNFTTPHQDSLKDGMCAEGNWKDHPIGPLFRAVKNNEIFEVEELLQDDAGNFKERVNEVDGDEVGVLHILALDRDVTEDDAVAMVQSLKDAGANLDLRAGRMMSSETPLHVAAW